MKISYKCDYALKTLLELAKNYNSKLLTIKELSKNLDIPQKFLEQILLELKKGGFANSKRGAIGGYYLEKSPNKIILGEVIRFIEGPLEPIACVNKNYKGCREINSCVFRNIWQRTAQAIYKIIDTVNFEDLLSDLNIQKEILSFNI